jgi:hypothetical protein
MFPKWFLIPMAAAMLLAPASFAEKAPSRSHAHLYVTGAGLLLMAGGGAFAYYQNREADRDMAVYRKSAFSDNTVALRESVEEHEHLTWAGLAGAALGGILVVVSF